jgi:hypothetical protein
MRIKVPKPVSNGRKPPKKNKIKKNRENQR